MTDPRLAYVGYAQSRRDPSLYYRRDGPITYFLDVDTMHLSWTAPDTAPEDLLRRDLIIERARLLGYGIETRARARDVAPGGILHHALGDEP